MYATRASRAALALAAGWLTAPTSALAQVSTDGATLSASISICASDLERPALERALRDVTQGLSIPITHGVQAQSERSEPRSIRILLDICAEEPRLDIIDARGVHIVRTVPRHGVDNDVLYEQLAQIVRASLEALLEASLLQPTPGRPERVPVPARPEPPVAPAALTPSVGLYYAATAYTADASVTHGPGGFAEVRWGARRPLWVAGGSAEYRFIERRDASADLHLDIVPLRLFAGISTGTGAAQLQLGLGGGVDLVRVAPATAELSRDLVAPHWLATAALRLQLRLTARITSGLSPFSVLALDVDPSATRYVVTRDGRRQVLVAPWPLRPSVGLGVAL